jgi:hypothetical protein
MRAPTPILLVALAALAVFLRWSPAPSFRLERSERDLAPSRWLVDDPATAYHARRIELALAGESTPQFDRYLNHPQGSEIAWSPVYDTAIAAVAQRGLRESGADPSLGGIEESRLEEFLMRVPPLIGAVTVLAVFWAVSRIVEGKRRTVCALLAAIAVAVAPLAVAQSSAGHLDHLSWIACLVAVQIAVSVRALRANDALASVFAALVTGILAGLELASFALGLALFIANWAAYLALARTGDAEKKRLAHRAGLLFCAIAAFVGRLPLSEGPWDGATRGILGAWSESACAIALLASIPFVVGFLFSRSGSTKLVRAAMIGIALAALLYNAPQMLRGAWNGWLWFRDHREELAILSPAHTSFVADAHRAEWLFLLTPACLVFVPAWIVLLGRRRRPEYVLLLVLGAITALLFACERRLGGVFVVPMACTLGAALDVALEMGGVRARRIAWTLAGASALVFAAHALAPALTEADPAQREERIEFVKGLRWMRDNTPAPGPWNVPLAANDWGVLTSFSAAHLVEYHARRPTVSSDLALIAEGNDAGAIARALLDDRPAEILRSMRATRSRYLVVGPRLLRDVPALERLANLRGPENARVGSARTSEVATARSREDATARSSEVASARSAEVARAPGTAIGGSMIARLSMSDDRAGAAPIEGLERVYSSARRVNIEGHAPAAGEMSGPAISIYRLLDSDALAPRAEMRAR